MEIEQHHWRAEGGWQSLNQPTLGGPADLVLIFGSRPVMTTDLTMALKKRFPEAILFGCSTAGEILDTKAYEGSITATAIRFKSTKVKVASRPVQPGSGGRVVGQELAEAVLGPDLCHVLVLSDGTQINGAELVKGLKEKLPAAVEVTGGLAGDDFRRQESCVIANDAPTAGIVAALGFYGQGLKIGYGSLGGWDPFGPDRLVTRSQGNVLYELDGKPALALYKRYLGTYAEGLPSTGLLFPLALRDANGEDIGVIRSIRSVNEAENSITSAGDIPEGGYVCLMKANFERLIEGAAGAARASQTKLAGANPELALLISCIGRKVVLQQRVEEEIESARQILGDKARMTGFYSYGEISPGLSTVGCELHNQTMTISTFSEP